ncbi:hypothetical protein BV25DRAFT_505800 [Artomyces pyxidatus]|uniref:Uncharacterized protein n=1 Tax=Artomyces pyxidatus TaxID=48021 RepID=A0ACB8TI16_9AGAM|nr:hypothetical protein BV25DRAFT_505800 [Artomyces pyxidatus]
MEAIGLGTPVARTPPGSGRRYSTPLSPNESVLLSATGVERGGGGRAERRLRRESGGELVRESVWRGRREKGSRESEVAESASFIDLSDEERSDHDRSDHNDLRAREPGHAQNRPQRRSFSPSSSLSPSLNDLSPRDPQDDDRRRNREKLAKLHRFLGSRVPADLVLGPSDSEPALPLPMPTALATKERRHLRRRSSSAAELKSSWYDDVDRVKEDLDEREKAIIVRRAIKMEKMFGTQPPQTLYHTRHSPVPPTSPMTFAPMGTAERHERQTPSPGGTVSPSSPTSMRNMNQTAYINKGRSGKGRRQSSRSSHSESTQNLLLDHDGSSGSPHSPIQFSPGNRASSIYMHYRHSLNSLNDIIDRDDKESLAELHQYLTNSELRDVEARTPTGRFEDTKAIRSQRRRSLPTRSSTLSLASQFTLGPPPDSEMVMFQARRRRAAKLTNFFGVDYRDLIGDILDSIENGVEEEGHKGSLQPEEVRVRLLLLCLFPQLTCLTRSQDLLQKLRNLKTKRSAAL